MKSCQIQVTKKEKEEETHQAFFFFILFFIFINPLGHYYYFIHTYILFLYFCHKLWFLLVLQQEDSRKTKKKKEGKFILVCLKTLWNLLQWVALDLLRPKPMVILKLLLFLSGFSGICSKFWYYLKKNVSECYCKK